MFIYVIEITLWNTEYENNINKFNEINEISVAYKKVIVPIKCTNYHEVDRVFPGFFLFLIITIQEIPFASWRGLARSWISRGAVKCDFSEIQWPNKACTDVGWHARITTLGTRDQNETGRDREEKSHLPKKPILHKPLISQIFTKIQLTQNPRQQYISHPNCFFLTLQYLFCYNFVA